jgi:hypothetical protein
MSDKGYNGWTNYETWNLALWIDNEQGSSEYWREQAAEVFKDTDEDDKAERIHQAANDLGDRLKDETEENAPELQGFYADVMNASISEVNFYEIAKNWIEEVADDILADEIAEMADDEQPAEDDITTEDHKNFYQNGKLVLELDEDADHIAALKEYMEKEQFYPNVWFISDHGNAHRIDLNAKA